MEKLTDYELIKKVREEWTEEKYVRNYFVTKFKEDNPKVGLFDKDISNNCIHPEAQRWCIQGYIAKAAGQEYGGYLCLRRRILYEELNNIANDLYGQLDIISLNNLFSHRDVIAVLDKWLEIKENL